MCDKRVLVFELRPYWQPELQRRFLTEDVDVIACRSVRDLVVQICRAQLDVIVLDLLADTDGLLRWLGRGASGSGAPPVVVIAAESHLHLEWHVRELGVVSWIDERAGSRQVAAVCRKLWTSAPPRVAQRTATTWKERFIS